MRHRPLLGPGEARCCLSLVTAGSRPKPLPRLNPYPRGWRGPGPPGPVPHKNRRRDRRELRDQQGQDEPVRPASVGPEKDVAQRMEHGGRCRGSGKCHITPQARNGLRLTYQTSVFPFPRPDASTRTPRTMPSSSMTWTAVPDQLFVIVEHWSRFSSDARHVVRVG